MDKLFPGMMGEILKEPLWLQAWILWMVVINTASVLFIRHRDGKAVLAAWVGNLVFMNLLFYLNGYNRLLGLSHVVFWTPLLVYIVLPPWDSDARTPYGVWLRVLVLTNGISLIVDYIDVVRYLLGDRT